jgi:hypothetical protein
MDHFFKMPLVESGMAFHDDRSGKRARNLQIHFTVFDQRSSTPWHDPAYEVHASDILHTHRSAHDVAELLNSHS